MVNGNGPGRSFNIPTHLRSPTNQPVKKLDETLATNITYLALSIYWEPLSQDDDYQKAF